ncbi:MAG TPA: sensor histidine kinase [Micromonosporaceae bacterium]|nr:sensor histidine kinase [Micromonosporaceae bacterium]
MGSRASRDGLDLVRRAGDSLVGAVLGAVTAFATLPYLIGTGMLLMLAYPWPSARRRLRRRVHAGARRLAAAELRRAAAMTRRPTPGQDATAAGADGGRALMYLAIRSPVGLLGAAVLTLLLYVVGNGVAVLWGWATGHGSDGLAPTPAILAYLSVGGAVMVFLIAHGLAGVSNLEHRLAHWLVEPTEREQFQQRIAELTATRADVVRAVDEERRRIERDLHDGVQQRLVALGMLIGQGRRSPDPHHAETLFRQAHEEAGRTLDALRDVTWRIYPTALDSGGLAAALESLADRAGIPVHLGGVPDGLDVAIQTAAYFVVCEAVTNAAKHAGADRVTVALTREADRIVVRVHDDGTGGADPAGGGLFGLAQRLAALDGRLHVDSPPGGPTTITAELPCA